MSKRSTNPRAKVGVDMYRDDNLFPRVAKAVDQLLVKGKVVAPVDVLVGMGLLDPKHLDSWRRGEVPYLEQVIDCNLTRLSRLLQILRFHAHDLNLVASVTTLHEAGQGPVSSSAFETGRSQ